MRCVPCPSVPACPPRGGKDPVPNEELREGHGPRPCHERAFGASHDRILDPESSPGFIPPWKWVDPHEATKIKSWKWGTYTVPVIFHEFSGSPGPVDYFDQWSGQPFHGASFTSGQNS